MIIYLIKLILILVFNIGVNTYYINSVCNCCCGNNKSGEIGGGSKGNLSTNPPEGLNPIAGPQIGEKRSGEGDGLEVKKAFLTSKLNQLIANNNALGQKKIDINIDTKAISSMKDQNGFNDINNKIDVLIKEYEIL